MNSAARRRFRVIAAGAAFAGLTLAAPAPAAADPVPPPDPAFPVPAEGGTPGPAPQTILGAEMLVDPVATLGALLANSPQPPAVGLAPLPPETVSSGPAPDPLASIGLLMPQNFRKPSADQVSPYPLAPNDSPSPFARIDAWKGVYALTHGGLGRMPGVELGQPLPGTAAPAGVNLPPGLEQFYIDPAGQVPPPSASPPAGHPLP